MAVLQRNLSSCYPVSDSFSFFLFFELQVDELRDKAPVVSDKPLSPAEVLQVGDHIMAYIRLLPGFDRSHMTS